MYIRILELLGFAKVKKIIPEPKFGEAESGARLRHLQAIVTHRYDVG